MVGRFCGICILCRSFPSTLWPVTIRNIAAASIPGLAGMLVIMFFQSLVDIQLPSCWLCDSFIMLKAQRDLLAVSLSPSWPGS